MTTDAGSVLAPLDASFLYLEGAADPLHVGVLALLEAPVPIDALVDLLASRLKPLVRYRQRPVRPAFDLGMPIWESVPDFDPQRHVHLVRLDAPGDDAELHRVVDALFAAPLDPARPLWEYHLIEGLQNGRAALLTKVHHCMIDGVSGAQIVEATTDSSPTREASVVRPLVPRRPAPPVPPLLERAWAASAGRVTDHARRLSGAAGIVADLVSAPWRPLPFNGTLTGARRIVWTTFSLDAVLAMRGVADCKVNDIVLAVITGALRHYLTARGVAPDRARLRALVPVNVRHEAEHLTLGNRVSALLPLLPIDAADPLDRLQRVTTLMRRLKETGQAHALEAVLDAAGLLPAAVERLVCRLGAAVPVAHTVCTNVPGPRDARFVLGRRILELHPIVPLGAGMGLGFAILSYGRALSIAATADPGLVPDAERIPTALRAAMDELADRLGVTTPPAVVPRRQSPRVAELMRRDVVTVGPHETLARAWETMCAARIRHLPVVRRDGTLAGILSHRDLLAASESSLAPRVPGRRVTFLGWACAGDLMEAHVSTVRADDAAAEAGARMMRQKIGCLPVTDADGRLAGIVTEEDFLRWATERMTAPAA